LSNEVLIEMFEEIAELEISYVKLYQELLAACDDEDVKKDFNEIISDEFRHAGNAKKILEIIKE